MREEALTSWCEGRCPPVGGQAPALPLKLGVPRWAAGDQEHTTQQRKPSPRGVKAGVHQLEEAEYSGRKVAISRFLSVRP